MSIKLLCLNPILVFLLSIVLAGCGSFAIPFGSAPLDSLEYDADPNLLLIAAQNLGPIMPPVAQCILLPDLRVWGDGRVVRVLSKGDRREVAVGQLNPDRVRELLLFLQRQGALSPWPRQVSAPNPSGARFIFRVQLKKGPVEQSAFPPPPVFFAELLDFLNPDLKPLIPQKAFLISTLGYGTPEQARDLPAGVNVSLAQAMEQGVWIDGDALDFFWDDVNHLLSSHTFRQNGKVYSVALEISGVGSKEPPEHCWAEWNKGLHVPKFD